MKLQTNILALLLLVVCMLPMCKKEPVEPDENRIQLTVADVGVTDATLHIKFNGVNKPRSFSLKRNGEEIFTWDTK